LIPVQEIAVHWDREPGAPRSPQLSPSIATLSCFPFPPSFLRGESRVRGFPMRIDPPTNPSPLENRGEGNQFLRVPAILKNVYNTGRSGFQGSYIVQVRALKRHKRRGPIRRSWRSPENSRQFRGRGRLSGKTDASDPSKSGIVRWIPR
jgi:hypothetical protein